MRKHTLETPGRNDEDGDTHVEVRVMRGFLFEVFDVPLVLDRCVDGLNRNYNLVVTTVGVPVPQPEETNAELFDASLEYVRWQFRLPGRNLRCGGEGLPGPEHVGWDDEHHDAAADDAYDVLTWERSSKRPKSFYERHFGIILFGVLFIFFRVFTSYRYHTQRVKIEREFLADAKGIDDTVKKAKLLAYRHNAK
jgi:hypothetical protein